MTTAEEYLDEQFPKGKTKFRGQAIVLLELARQDILQKIRTIIRNAGRSNTISITELEGIIEESK